jgi:hypothetical protein
MKNNLPENWLVKKDENHKDWPKVVNSLFPNTYFNVYTWLYYGHFQGNPFYTDIISPNLRDIRILTIDEFVELSKEEKMIPKKDFSVKGTKLPIMDNVRYRCCDWGPMCQDRTFRDKRNLVSYGITAYESVMFVLAEESRYTGSDYYMIRLDDVKRLEKKHNEESSRPKTYILEREDLKEIHDIACPTWQKKIAKIASEQPFGNISLTQEQVNEMFKAATPEQLPTLKKIFPSEIDLMSFQLKISDDGRAFILPSNANWVINRINGVTLLTPTFN